MNFLAHLYFSGSDEDLQFGNFIADFVKGSQQLNYSAEVQSGIQLHRFIDEYTDSHPVVLKEKENLRADFRKYAGVVLDVYFDHFLANSWNQYHNQELRQYIDDVYAMLSSRYSNIPERGKPFHTYMMREDILFRYQYLEGIDLVFQGMSRRSKFDSGMERGAIVLDNHFDRIEAAFQQFFPDLKQEAKLFRTH